MTCNLSSQKTQNAFFQFLRIVSVAGLLAAAYDPAFAYIGPGAGFAFLGSFFVFFIVFFLAIGLFLTWPIRLVWRRITGKRPYHGQGKVNRVIIVGLDGLCPERSEKMMNAGRLPNLAALRKEGCFKPLQTTTPPISPVAWSSFQTGSNPARHNIFDFLAPDRKTYLPLLSSAHIGDPRRVLKIGKYIIPLTKPELRLLRKSKPFWTTLGEHLVFSTVLRVPITFPPEKFYGLSLSAMCVPDLRGTQGSFTYFTDNPEAANIYAGGAISKAIRSNGIFECVLEGPANTLTKDAATMKINMKIKPNGDSAEIDLGDQKLNLKVGESSDWIRLSFSAMAGIKVTGIARFIVKSLKDPFGIYMSPINIDPDSPALPISHPAYYSTYLSKKHGAYATLGLAEDTWGLNERVLDEADFLEQCWRHHEEREKMLFDAIDHARYGSVVCVFDTTDRIQHMFMRYDDPAHPANKGKDTVIHKNALDDLYKKCDETVGRVRKMLGPRDVLIVMSDHGFRSFRRGVNINSWLLKEGYMVLKEGKSSSGEWFEGVDWSRTRAYALGLSGVFVNKQGREGKGIVPADRAEVLAKEIAAKLTGLVDSGTGAKAILKAYVAREVYAGPYLDNAPEVIVGYEIGYRASWDGVTGYVNDVIFDDNAKSWSGDHCIDASLVPGSFFCNKSIGLDKVRMIDIAPTVLDLFDVPKPGYMDGKSLEINLGKKESGNA